MVPSVYQYKNWDLVFNPSHDGVSFGTFYLKAQNYNPTFMLIRDTKQNVFGVFASQIWRDGNEFYGTGETFVFSFKVRRLKL